MSTIVYYYSRTGNNKYLAEKIAKELNCTIEKIRPRADIFIFYLLKISFGLKKFKNAPENFDRVILVGPIWMGRFVTPLKSFVSKYSASIKALSFVTCCGTSDEVKFEKFGHGLVFKQIESILGDKCISCDAFPIGLTLPENEEVKGDAVMKIRLNDSNFNGVIKQRFDKYIQQIIGK